MFFLAKTPFSKTFDNQINIYNEAVIIVTFISILIMNTYDFLEYTREIWGWVLIVSIAFSLLATWVEVIPGVVKELWIDIKKLFKKPKKSRRHPKFKIKKPGQVQNGNKVFITSDYNAE